MTRTAKSWALVVPALSLTGAWIYLPLLLTLFLSVTDWNLVLGAPHFVGLQNYRAVLTDPDNLTSFVNTVLYALVILPLLVLLPIPVAIALGRYGGRLRGVYRLTIFFPVMVAPVVAAFMWQWLLNPTGGVLPAAFEAIGLAPPQLLQSQGSALWTVAGLTVWKTFGLSVVLYAAGLSGIDQTLIEAARTDGAPEWRTTWHVVLPMLRPTVAVVAFLALINSSQWAFAFVNVLTQGGPEEATTNALYQIYQLGLVEFNDGQASALAVLVVVVFALLSAVVLRFGRSASAG